MRAALRPSPLVRHLALTVLAVALGLAVRAHAAPDDLQVTPGEFVVEHPTLINLGFEWHIDGDANRNARVEVSFRKQGETAWRTGMPLAAPARRAGVPAEHLQPGGAEHVRRQHPGPRAGHRLRGALRADRSRRRRAARPRERDQGRHGADAAGADAGRRRQGLSRLSRRSGRGRRSSRRSKGIMCAYNYYCGAGDTAPGGRPRVKPGDTDPRARRHLRVSLRVLRQPDHRQRHDDVRGDLLPDRRRHAGEADRHQGRGRRRGDHRRPRQLQPVQRQGRRLQLLRGDHLPEHRHRDLGGHAVHRRREGADREALPLRGRRAWACSPTTRGRATSTSPTACSSAGTIRGT